MGTREYEGHKKNLGLGAILTVCLRFGITGIARQDRRRFHMEFDGLSRLVIGRAIDVHKKFGPGLLEHTYEELLDAEFAHAGIPVHRQAILPLSHFGREIPNAYRIDMIVANELILEIKALEHVLPVHRAQVITYLRLSGLKVGLLINFHVPRLSQGIIRFVN